MRDLLFLAQRLPHPPIKGEKIRHLQVLKYLAQSYNIYLGCLSDNKADIPHIDTLCALCRDIHVAWRDRRMAYLTCMQGLLIGQSLSVMFFRQRGLLDWVRNVIQTVRPAVIFVGSSNMAPYVLDLPHAGTRVVDLMDVDSAKWRAYANKAVGPMRLVYRREWRAISALEHRIARECDLASFVSDAEAALFASQAPDCAGRIRSIRSGVDHRYFDPALDHAPAYDTSRPTYVFTGTMDYPPNIDAVIWFANAVLPEIRRTLPAAQFYVVGNDPTSRVKRLRRIDGVFITGRVPDVRPYVVHATASVAPMGIARGIQNKVLEAMSLARPVVLTASALEGIAAEPGRDVIVRETADGFATACARLATSDDGVAIGRAARACVLRHHDWAVTLRGFDDVLRPIAAS